MLSRMLNVAAEYGVFKYHPKCKKIKLTHLCFANDLFIFSKGDLESIIGSGIIQEEPLCPPGSTRIHMQPYQGMCPSPNITPPPVQTTQEICPIPSPLVGTSTFPHATPSIGQVHESGQYEVNPGANLLP